MAGVAGRYWCTKLGQWVNKGFSTIEDAEEWQSDTGILLEKLHTIQRSTTCSTSKR